MSWDMSDFLNCYLELRLNIFFIHSFSTQPNEKQFKKIQAAIFICFNNPFPNVYDFHGTREIWYFLLNISFSKMPISFLSQFLGLFEKKVFYLSKTFSLWWYKVVFLNLLEVRNKIEGNFINFEDYCNFWPSDVNK